MALSAHLAKYADILKSLRPQLATTDEREALMAAIYDDFSERNLAEVLADVFEADRHVLLGQAIDAFSRLRDAPSAVHMRDVLEARGWDFHDEGPGRR